VNLPIDAVKSEFLRHLPYHHLVVESDTGSGKSTRLPLWANTLGKVLVVEPRRLACTALATFLSKQENCPVGKRIGYAIRFDHRYDDNTEIVFVTPGIALSWLSENGLSDYAVILIDEFHERRWDTDVLLAMLKARQQHRLIVTSATLEGQRLADYLDATRLQAEGRLFPIDVHYLADDPRRSPDSRHLEKNIISALNGLPNDHQGDILIFLPGRKEIQSCQTALKPWAEKHAQSVDIIPLHATVSETEKHRALTQSDQKRLILATNVAETSLTIPNVTVVIDSGLERRTHQQHGRTVLTLHAISQASREQRKGRAGRTAAGVCYRLYGQSAPLELMTPPEMHREELTEPMLSAAHSGHILKNLTFLDSLPEKSHSQAVERLRAMQAIDNNHAITEHGKRLAPLPIDALFAHLITLMPTKSTQEAMVDLASALSASQRLYQTPKTDNAFEEFEKWSPEGCDAMRLIQLVRGQYPDSLTIQPDALREARQLSHQIRESLNLPELSVASRVNRIEWLKIITENFPELVFIRREKRRQAFSNSHIEMQLGREQHFPDKAEAALVFNQFHLSGRSARQTLTLATCLSPIPLSWLNEFEFGDITIQESQWKNGQCQSRIQRHYGGRLIAENWVSDTQTLSDEQWIQLLDNNKLLPNFSAERRQEIQHWNLYLALGKYDAQFCQRENKAIAFEDWFHQQRQDLGIEIPEEFALFTADDFPFDGIPEWQKDEFSTRYPNQLQLADLTLTVEYHVAGKRITLHYLKGNTKHDPKRWELPQWTGWRIQYKKASRTLNIV
jgi:HrpA-like RNA helicase